MVSKCANPQCSTRFQYLREGKLFRFEDLETQAGRSRPYLVGKPRSPRQTEHFWLCGPCSESLTVSYEHERGVVVVPVATAKVHRAAAS